MARPAAPPLPPLEPDQARRIAGGLALRWLSGRELSAARVASRLAERGFERDTIEEVVARLLDSGAIDDARAVRACARNLVVVRLRGRLRAQRELEAMGFGAQLVRDALQELLGEADELALARRVLAARMRGRPTIPDAATYRRLYGALFRRGFSASIVREALKPFWRRGSVPDESGTIE